MRGRKRHRKKRETAGLKRWRKWMKGYLERKDPWGRFKPFSVSLCIHGRARGQMCPHCLGADQEMEIQNWIARGAP